MKLYLLVSVYQNGKQIVKSSATSIEPPGLLSDLLKITLSINDIPNVNISVDFQRDKSNEWHIVSKGINEDLEILDFLKAIHIRFTWNDENDDINDSQTKNPKNALDILMSNATGIHLPSAQVHTTSGAKFVSRLSNLIWYIDPHHSKFTSRSCHLPKFVDDLPEYKAKSSYNQYYINSHHKKTEIQAQTLQRHVEAMENSLVQPWASDKKWEQFISEVIQLCEVSRKFIEYLDNVNKRMRIIHNSSVPIRNGIDHIKVLDIDKTLTTNENYNEIIKLMHEKEEFEPTCIDDLILCNVIQPVFLENMELPFSVTLY
ncbi:unnamed protein product [Rhizophagus irregularis]|uniref:Uncharacterized protein n=1 Tax=Rhizophagus irregularis TaxID=588596 RepID=A0A915ZKE8_9GLOM|nr:unnamed protein product [Rhizophagus irregularis]